NFNSYGLFGLRNSFSDFGFIFMKSDLFFMMKPANVITFPIDTFINRTGSKNKQDKYAYWKFTFHLERSYKKQSSVVKQKNPGS
ncbi:MAG: hypothetical protein K0S32_1221, partial [Bacteroidetes bacterium]|nr:hypothetical protein [Bacteroidota bacterium]